MKKSNIIVAIISVLIATSAVTLGTYTNDRMMEKVATKMEDEAMSGDASMNAMDKETYTLKFLSGIQYQPGRPAMLEFTVEDHDGKRLNQEQYKIEQEKRMHVIVASQDLRQFQHVHPVYDSGSNSFKLPDFTFPVAGNYRIFTDFVVDSHDEAEGKMDMEAHGSAQYQDVIVGQPGSGEPLPLGPATTSVMLDDDVKVDLAVKPGPSKTEKYLHFTLTRDGRPVTDLQRYLGALGHLVVLSEGKLEYIHTHAVSTDINKQTGKVSFEVNFKETGTFKAFAQFQRNSTVMTGGFVVKVD